MIPMSPMRPEPAWLTFDCFGTLVDWRHGISTSAELLFPGRGQQVLHAFHRHEPHVQAEQPTLRYRRVLAESLRRACADLRLSLPEDDADILGCTIPFWPVFPDVRPALRRLSADGWRLALLTNCDNDLIAETQRRLGVPIATAVTAEHAGGYKPALGHFQYFEQTFGVDRERWIHVAQSYVHDIRPTHALGIRSVWINRLSEDADPSLAAAVLPDLAALPQTIGQLSA
jgi:2-haloacid dehalogenase